MLRHNLFFLSFFLSFRSFSPSFFIIHSCCCSSEFISFPVFSIQKEWPLPFSQYQSPFSCLPQRHLLSWQWSGSLSSFYHSSARSITSPVSSRRKMYKYHYIAQKQRIMLENIIAKESKFNKSSPIPRWPRRRTLVVLVGLPTVRFDFFSALCSLMGVKKRPVVFPTRHRRCFYSVFCKLLFIFPGDHLSHGQCIKVLVLWCRAFSWFSSSKNSFSVFILWLLLGQVNRILTDTPLSVQISILKCLVHCF